MTGNNLTTGAKAYVAAVLFAGAASGVALLAISHLEHWNWLPLVVLTTMGVLSTAISVSYQGFKPSITVHQIGTSFAYALFLLADPAAVGFSLCLIAVADWVVNRRSRLPALFNIAQLWLSLGIAVAVRHAVDARFTSVSATDLPSLVAAAVSLIAFFVVNHLLTHGIVSLASRTPFLTFDLGTRIGILNESLCVVSGIGTAVFWSIRPALAILGIIPVWILVMLVLALSRREQQLENQQAELRSLQEIGLEIGSELDVERLQEAVVRIVADALHVAGALLAGVDQDRKKILVLCQRGVTPAPPGELAMSAATCAVISSGRIERVEDYVPAPDRYPEFAVLGATGFLCAPLQIRGKREGLLIVFRGMSRRPFDEGDVRRLETLVRFIEMALSNARLVSELKQMQTQLVQTEKMSALGMLVSGVAHEVNNPLTSVLGYTQLALGQERDPNIRNMLEKVAQEAIRAGKIVQNLLAFSRKQKSERQPTDINRVLDMVIDLHAYELQLRNVKVERRLSASLPPVLVDPEQMQQVFLNLVTNAEHAVQDSGRPGRIVVESRLQDDRVQVVIADSGVGIARDNLDKIFMPFFTTKEVGRGTGLGLAICYGIVEDHGGRINVSSQPGEGATFTIDLPTSAAPAEVKAPVTTARSEVETPSAAGRLLVVDDEALIADLVRDVLGPLGWAVDIAGDGLEALDILAEHEFDVLLVDMRMPGMDGRAFYGALRESRPALTERLVFATGDTGSDTTSEFLAETGNRVLRKPYDIQELIDTVSRVATAAAGGTPASKSSV